MVQGEGLACERKTSRTQRWSANQSDVYFLFKAPNQDLSDHGTKCQIARLGSGFPQAFFRLPWFSLGLLPGEKPGKTNLKDMSQEWSHGNGLWENAIWVGLGRGARMATPVGLLAANAQCSHFSGSRARVVPKFSFSPTRLAVGPPGPGIGLHKLKYFCSHLFQELLANIDLNQLDVG